MAHYAFLDPFNVVTHVIVGCDETAQPIDWEQRYSEITGQVCKRTSYNTCGGIHYNPKTKEPDKDQSKAFRKNYAGKGFTYDPNLDAFIPPKPFPSWLLNTESCLWEAPVPYPTDGRMYRWDEQTQSWVSIEML